MDGVDLHRQNPKGVTGKWLCAGCLSLLEEFEGIPHFLHSADCPNYCDYACNPRGFETAERIAQIQQGVIL